MVKVKVKASHTRHRALGPELIPVYRQSAHVFLPRTLFWRILGSVSVDADAVRVLYVARGDSHVCVCVCVRACARVFAGGT